VHHAFWKLADVLAGRWIDVSIIVELRCVESARVRDPGQQQVGCVHRHAIGEDHVLPQLVVHPERVVGDDLHATEGLVEHELGLVVVVGEGRVDGLRDGAVCGRVAVAGVVVERVERTARGDRDTTVFENTLTGASGKQHEDTGGDERRTDPVDAVTPLTRRGSNYPTSPSAL